MHNYFTNYHAPTRFDTILLSSGILQSVPCQVTRVFQVRLLVTQFTVTMFHIGFMQVLIYIRWNLNIINLWSIKIILFTIQWAKIIMLLQFSWSQPVWWPYIQYYLDATLVLDRYVLSPRVSRAASFFSVQVGRAVKSLGPWSYREKIPSKRGSQGSCQTLQKQPKLTAPPPINTTRSKLYSSFF